MINLYQNRLLFPYGFLPRVHFARPGGPSLQLPGGVPESHICVLSGTNVATVLTRNEAIKGSFSIETKFGTSPEIFYGEVSGIPFYHIPLHGHIGADRSKMGADTDCLLRAWTAMHLLGVKEVLGGATAGALNTDIKVGDWVIPDDFIDYNVDRPRTITYMVLGRDAGRIFPRINPATDPEIDNILYDACVKFTFPEYKTWKGGILVQDCGGRFEGVAESRLWSKEGMSIVTTAIGTEIAYARQLGMNYGCFNGISTPAEGLVDWDWDWDDLAYHYPRFHELSVKIYLDAIPKVAALAGKPRVGDRLRFHPPLEPDLEA